MSKSPSTAVVGSSFIPSLNPEAIPLFVQLCRLKSSLALFSQRSTSSAWWSPTLTLMSMILGHLLGHASLEQVQEFLRSGIADPLCCPSKLISSFLVNGKSTAGFLDSQ